MGARRCKVTCPHYAVWLLDGEGWQGLGEERYSIPEARSCVGRKAKVLTMAANEFHYIEIRTCDPTPSPNVSLLSHLLHPSEGKHHPRSCSGKHL